MNPAATRTAGTGQAERDRAERDAPEARGEEQIECASVDQEANGCENADYGGDYGDRGVEREPRVAQLVRDCSMLRRRAPFRREQGDEQQLAVEPRAVAL
jgi:hypothetical protein